MKRTLSLVLATLMILAVVALVIPTSVFADESPRLTINKTAFFVGEDILVTAVGEGADWVGLYLEEDHYDPAKGGVSSIMWYYVAKDGNESGRTKNLRDCEYLSTNQRADLLSIPVGNYKVVLMANDGYEVIAELHITMRDMPTSYVREDLAAWYDGVNNTRSGHNAEAAAWEDQVGNMDIPVEKDANNMFAEDGLHVRAKQYAFPQGVVDLVNGNAFTVELLLGDFQSIGNHFNTFLNSDNDNLALFRRNSNNVIEFKFAGNAASEKRPTVADGLNTLQNALVTITYEVGGETAIYINGVKQDSAACAKAMGANTLFIGHADGSKSFDTTYRSIRFYSRALNPVEIAHNAVVDGKMSAADLYVAEGQVAIYSGLQNTKGGNDIKATTWADLRGSNDITLTTDELNAFVLGGFRINKTSLPLSQAIVNAVNGEEFTVELKLSELTSKGAKDNLLIGSDNGNFALAYLPGGDQLELTFAGNQADDRLTIENAAEKLADSVITITYKVGGEAIAYINGVKVARVASPAAAGADKLFLGSDEDEHAFSALLGGLRIYNRALTAEEVLKNAKADLAVAYDYVIKPKTYTATFVANNQIVAKVVFEDGATSIEEPAVPEREGYVGVWADYKIVDRNFSVRAIYTPVAGGETETSTETATAETATDTATEPTATDPVSETEKTTEATETTVAPAATTGMETATEEAGKGCGSAIGGGAALLLCFASATVLVWRRKND